MGHLAALLMSSVTVVAMGEMFGYARVSTAEQNDALQQDALKAAGCFRIFSDHASGALTTRPELGRLMEQLRPGDTLVVWRLDRLGRSLKHLIDTVNVLEAQGVGFRSLQENIDTTSPGGRLVFHVFGALAEFERDLISSRTRAGLEAARARGRTGGRPSLLDGDKLETARSLYEQGQLSVESIGGVLGVSRTTVYRSLRQLSDSPVGRSSRQKHKDA